MNSRCSLRRRKHDDVESQLEGIVTCTYLGVKVPMKRSSCWMYAETAVNEFGVTLIPLMKRSPFTWTDELVKGIKAMTHVSVRTYVELI